MDFNGKSDIPPDRCPTLIGTPMNPLHSACNMFVYVAAVSFGAAAADYPDKPIRMVVPWSPGGGSDVSGRIVAAKLTEALGQQVVVDNRPGAAGNIGTAITAKAAADGYTILLADTGFSTGISLYQNPGYHPLKDFAPVSLAAITPIVAVVHPAVKATSVRELIALAKAEPGKLNFGSGGTGGSVHLAGEMFLLRTGTKMIHVPYKGSGPAAVDLAGGVVQVMFATAPAVMPLIKGNRIRPLGVASNTRSIFLPDVPTMKEAGVPDFVADNWYGVLVPTGTPKPVIERLQREIAKAVVLPDAKERFFGAGLEAQPSKTSQEFGAFVENDVARWAGVIKQANIKME
jgi:tripartite-type tricarboxylate transporter receptor subunit TctC